MTQFSILLAGFAILAASLILASLGRVKRAREVRVFEREGVNLGLSDNITERRLPFTVQVDSEAVLNIKRNEGRFEITIRQVPIPMVPEANVGWISPTLYQKMSNGENHKELALGPGTYAVVLKNEHSGTSNAEVSLTLKSWLEAYPKLYDVGIQMLVVAVPLIVAGLVA